MVINGVNPYFAQPKPIEDIVPKQEPAKTKESGKAGESFGDMFSNMIREVDDLQKTADRQIEGVVMGEEGVTTHGAMLALEKADVAFQLMSNIRAKIIRAYEEVLRTAV